jgi:hypothetical protein
MKGLVLDAVWEPRADYVVSDWEKETGKAITGNSIWRHPELEVRKWEDPKPGPNDVLLEVRACGVCGSDMHFYETDDQGYILYPGLTKFPTILGHEFSGKVAEVGKDVTTLKVGDMVTVEEMIPTTAPIWKNSALPFPALSPTTLLWTRNSAGRSMLSLTALAMKRKPTKWAP